MSWTHLLSPCMATAGCHMLCHTSHSNSRLMALSSLTTLKALYNNPWQRGISIGCSCLPDSKRACHDAVESMEFKSQQTWIWIVSLSLIGKTSYEGPHTLWASGFLSEKWEWGKTPATQNSNKDNASSTQKANKNVNRNFCFPRSDILLIRVP